MLPPIEPIVLSLEQQFELERMTIEASGMSRDELQEMVLGLARLMMLRDNVMKGLIKKCS